MMRPRQIRAVVATSFAVLMGDWTGADGRRYPQDAIRCMSSLKEPDGKLICPEHRDEYCVKEISTLSKADCGRTGYYGDKWNPRTGKCEYRKCGDTCEDLSWDFEFEGETYERNRFCCGYDYCNGSRFFSMPATLAWVLGAVISMLAWVHL